MDAVLYNPALPGTGKAYIYMCCLQADAAYAIISTIIIG